MFVIVALTAAFLVLLFDKVGLINVMQTKGSKTIARLGSCKFCLAFWACVVVSIIFAIFGAVGIGLITPVVATPITRFLV